MAAIQTPQHHYIPPYSSNEPLEPRRRAQRIGEPGEAGRLGAPWFLAFAAEEKQWQARPHARWQAMREIQLLRIGSLWLWVCSGLDEQDGPTSSSEARHARLLNKSAGLDPIHPVPLRPVVDDANLDKFPALVTRSNFPAMVCELVRMHCTFPMLRCADVRIRPRGPTRILRPGARQPLPEVPFRPVRGLRSQPEH